MLFSSTLGPGLLNRVLNNDEKMAWASGHTVGRQGLTTVMCNSIQLQTIIL